jgi:hypothetical protein
MSNRQAVEDYLYPPHVDVESIFDAPYIDRLDNNAQKVEDSDALGRAPQFPPLPRSTKIAAESSDPSENILPSSERATTSSANVRDLHVSADSTLLRTKEQNMSLHDGQENTGDSDNGAPTGLNVQEKRHGEHVGSSENMKIDYIIKEKFANELSELVNQSMQRLIIEAALIQISKLQANSE